MSQPTRVLVVEDDGHLLSAIRDILELEDYHVATATNGADAIKVLRKNPVNPPDVIVSDIMMPHMNGFDLLEAVRQEDQWVNVPFIFLTAKGEKTDIHRGRRLGADVYLTKPFDPDDLIVAVDACLKRQQNIKRVQQGEVSTVKKKILTILNHEFRTPLTLVVAYADMLKEFDASNMDESEIMSFLRGVNSGADRLRRLIENFIVLVEIDTGDAARTFEWRCREVNDIRLIVEDAFRQVELPDQRPRQWQFNIPPELPGVMVDAQFLTVMIRELMDNAAKFSRSGDLVTVSVRIEGDQLVIDVVDQGRGIPDDILPRIWDPFFQHNREEFEDQGSGSGLAIVAGLTELHHGTYTVDSVEGEGSTFTIQLPLTQPET